ncbi:hypothetical protein B0H14DRAFT_3771446 [Mycena olivaceomarginata]|nr:hypothetical protein B0H14DRAFT_3771446 [Mycena olivaceomarginata]
MNSVPITTVNASEELQKAERLVGIFKKANTTAKAKLGGKGASGKRVLLRRHSSIGPLSRCMPPDFVLEIRCQASSSRFGFAVRPLVPTSSFIKFHGFVWSLGNCSNSRPAPAQFKLCGSSFSPAVKLDTVNAVISVYFKLPAVSTLAYGLYTIEFLAASTQAEHYSSINCPSASIHEDIFIQYSLSTPRLDDMSCDAWWSIPSSKPSGEATTSKRNSQVKKGAERERQKKTTNQKLNVKDGILNDPRLNALNGDMPAARLRAELKQNKWREGSVSGVAQRAAGLYNVRGCSNKSRRFYSRIKLLEDGGDSEDDAIDDEGHGRRRGTRERECESESARARAMTRTKSD